MHRILLVEDNEDDVELTLRAFARNDLADELIVARDGVEALEMLHGPDPITPAVILLDLKLPRIDGFDVLRALRADPRTRLIPVVILTSSAQERDLLETYELRANSYIVKPVVFEHFVAAAREIGIYWLMLNTLPPLKPSS